MKLSQFDFNLPSAQVALYPHSIERTVTNDKGEETTFSLKRPDECRMVVVHKKSQKIEIDKTFLDVFDYFKENDMFVFNNTRVFPARLYGTKEKTDAKIEVFLLRELNQEMRLWDVLVEPARKIRIGNKLFFNEEGTLVAEVIDNTTSRGRTLRFLYDCPHDEFKEAIFGLGQAPLPRYIIDHKDSEGNLDRPVTDEDFNDFQTVFAEVEGAVTAPSTGLHFTRQMMKRLDIHGIKTAFITLHCGLGIFHPIEVEDLSKHKMDSEEMHVTEETCDTINTAKKNGSRICCVGASVLKATETVVGTDGFIKPYDGWTNKFIFPPYNYGLADSCLVNLYHPKSTMVMATAAFGGYDLVMDAYNQALKAGYSFGCFGDVMLIMND
ncbi:MAG: tRNA preQ1(34) S-adenosylmethionine ribosyltransferase-isomerase QueA [Prevotella sp.]|nr:tRNA preQ1(34) S-adenosylmethionine ribosyltransferase-isomerase QueA [Prevotella sp.]